jgi:acetylornithine deacetylase/succinyl-diaminopimelate desuccinylase-like protein
MEDVQARLRTAAWRGVDEYLRLVGASAVAKDVIQVSYEKLHNAAFAGAPDSPDMHNAVEAAKATGLWRDEPIRGWDVSCDSRIFACEYPDLTVITTGPGSLRYAHSDHEHIDIPEMVRFAEFLAYFILKQTGTG